MRSTQFARVSGKQGSDNQGSTVHGYMTDVHDRLVMISISLSNEYAGLLYSLEKTCQNMPLTVTGLHNCGATESVFNLKL